jgi:uncharacterized paraquat-inducible protein A
LIVSASQNMHIREAKVKAEAAAAARYSAIKYTLVWLSASLIARSAPPSSIATQLAASPPEQRSRHAKCSCQTSHVIRHTSHNTPEAMRSCSGVHPLHCFA